MLEIMISSNHIISNILQWMLAINIQSHASFCQFATTSGEYVQANELMPKQSDFNRNLEIGRIKCGPLVAPSGICELSDNSVKHRTTKQNSKSKASPHTDGNTDRICMWWLTIIMGKYTSLPGQNTTPTITTTTTTTTIFSLYLLESITEGLVVI